MTAQHPLQPHPQSMHTFSDDLLGRHDATGLAELIHNGDVSAGEVLQATLARARIAEPFIHGLVTPIPDDGAGMIANKTPAAKTVPGIFAGVPTVIKDNTEVKGFPTSHGTAAIHSHPADETSPFALSLIHI